jgi:hypothetical protein
MKSEIRVDGKRLIFKSKLTRGKWALLWEPGGKCWACGEDGVLISDTDTLFILTCIRCGNAIHLTGMPKRLEIDK